MTAEIICVGTELLLGDIVNTNAQFLSQELAQLGISVLHQHVVGDNPARLRALVLETHKRSDLLVFSGGLGPTEDDITKETVAEVFGVKLVFDAQQWQKITAFFTRMGHAPTPNNRKQAMVPAPGGASRALENAHGTAPGVWFEDESGHCAVLMPGVPREMRAMWFEQVRPILEAKRGGVIRSRTLRVLGGESRIADKVAPLFSSENPTAAIYCKTGECEIRVTAKAPDAYAAQAQCDAYLEKFRDILGDDAYDTDVPGLAWTVVRVLRERGIHVATAESCTGGLIAKMLTDVPGSSEVFAYGFVAYSQQAKQRMLGLPAALLERYGVYSGPVAAAMAQGASRESGAQLAVGVTGIAGPGGAQNDKDPGTVYVAGFDARSGKTYLYRLALGAYADREVIRVRTALYALDLVRRMALGKDVLHAIVFEADAPADAMNL